MLLIATLTNCPSASMNYSIMSDIQISQMEKGESDSLSLDHGNDSSMIPSADPVGCQLEITDSSTGCACVNCDDASTALMFCSQRQDRRSAHLCSFHEAVVQSFQKTCTEAHEGDQH